MTRVLLADDSGTMRTIIRRSLEALGVTGPTEASDGLEAVSLFRPGEFDLVVTDGNMPGKNGLDVVRDIRGRDPRVPIVMIATETERAHVLAAIEAGVSDYLVKPFTAERLREKLARFIPAD